MIVPVPRVVLILAGLVLAAAVGSAVYQSRTATRFETERDSLLARMDSAAARRLEDSVTIDRVTTGLEASRAELTGAVAMSQRLADEAARLRRERADVVVVSSVPGEVPTVGDTLRACRIQLGLCEREAAVQKLRADSLEDVTQGAVMHASSLQDDVAHWKQSFTSLQALLNDARPVLAAAAPPCWLVRFGPIRAQCPDRTTVALAAAGATLAAVGKTREQRVAGLALITIGIAW